MADTTDTLLLAMAPGLAKAQIVEVKIKKPDDGSYELSLDELDPVVVAASGDTIETIRDGLADQLISPTYDDFTVKKIITDRFRVKGTPGDPFEATLVAPNGATSATLTTIQQASGATTELRAFYLSLAIKLIKCDVWKDKTQEGQTLLAAFFISRALLAIKSQGQLVVGGQASGMSLGGASVSLGGAGLVMPSDGELAGDPLYGGPLLILMRSVTYGPIWS